MGALNFVLDVLIGFFKLAFSCLKETIGIMVKVVGETRRNMK